MFMDESVAKGLASRVIQHFKETDLAMMERAARYDAQHPPIFYKRGKWESYARGMTGLLEPTMLRVSEAGGKRHRLVCIQHLYTDKNRTTEWDEDAVHLTCSYIPQMRRIRAERIDRAILGPHALARIIERQPFPGWAQAGAPALFEHALGAVSRECRSVGAWSAALFILLQPFIDEDPQKSFRYAIPTPGGLLIAGTHGNRDLCSVRTFVSNQQLSDSQKRIKAELLRAMTPELNDTIAALVFSRMDFNESVAMALNVFFARVREIMPLWLGMCRFKMPREEFNEIRRQAVSRCERYARPDLDALYERHGLGTLSWALDNSQMLLNRLKHGKSAVAPNGAVFASQGDEQEIITLAPSQLRPTF